MNKKMHRALIAVFFLLYTALSGCGIKELFMDEYEEMDRAAVQVLKALDERDTEALKTLFCKEVIQKQTDLEQDIADVLRAYEGKSKSSNRISYNSESYFDKGKHSREIYAAYEVNTDDGRYYLSFAYWPVNTIDADMEGIYSIDLSVEEAYKARYYMPDTDFPGIHFQKVADEKGNVMLLYGNPRRYTYVERGDILLDEAFLKNFIDRSQSYKQLTNEAGPPNGELSKREYVFELSGSTTERKYAVCSLGVGDAIGKIEIVNEEEILYIMWEHSYS